MLERKEYYSTDMGFPILPEVGNGALNVRETYANICAAIVL